MRVGMTISVVTAAGIAAGFMIWPSSQSPWIAIRSCSAIVRNGDMPSTKGSLGENSQAVEIANSLIKERGWKVSLVSYVPSITLTDSHDDFTITFQRTLMIVNTHRKRFKAQWVHRIAEEQYDQLKQAILKDIE